MIARAKERPAAERAAGRLFEPADEMAVRSFEEIAAIMTDAGLPMGRSRVQQIHKRAIQKLREGLADLETELDER